MKSKISESPKVAENTERERTEICQTRKRGRKEDYAGLRFVFTETFLLLFFFSFFFFFFSFKG
jgi:hypothetical protein